MLERVVVDLTGGRIGLLGAVFRYEVLERLAKTAAGHRVQLLAFGFGRTELRLVVKGDTAAITNALRGLKVGTLKAAARWGLTLQASPNVRLRVADAEVCDAVAWAHGAPVEAGASCALASPWSSHRDVFGFRRARFYNPSSLHALVDPHQLEVRLGETRVLRWYDAPLEDIRFLLRIAAGVVGVLPANRRCFRLFVHLARTRGFENKELAGVLALTTRRVRQLASEVEPNLDLALCALSDGRLARVP